MANFVSLVVLAFTVQTQTALGDVCTYDAWKAGGNRSGGGWSASGNPPVCTLPVDEAGSATIPAWPGCPAGCSANTRAADPEFEELGPITLDPEGAAFLCPHQDEDPSYNGYFTVGDWLFCPKMFGMPDAVCVLRHAWQAMPFWALPVANSGKAVAMFAVLKFDIKMELTHLADPTLATRAFDAAKTVPLIGLVANGWWHDLLSPPPPGFFTANGIVGNDRTSGFGPGRAALRWASSPNFVAATAFWSALALQSPASALRLKPRYATAFGSNMAFPLHPTGAHWLSPWKWLYGIILLPYLLPIITGVWLWNRAVSLRCCRCIAWALAGVFLLVVSCDAIGTDWSDYDSMLARNAGFGLFATETTGLLRDPFVGTVGAFTTALVLWAWSAIVPHIFTRPYGTYVGASASDMDKTGLTVAGVLKAVCEVFVGSTATSESKPVLPSLPEPLQLDEDDVTKLRGFNKEALEIDFSAELLPAAEEGMEVQEGGDDGLNDTRMAIVLGTLKSVGRVMRMQLALIIGLRFCVYFAILHTSPFVALVMATHFTVSERTSQAFVFNNEVSVSTLLYRFWNTV